MKLIYKSKLVTKKTNYKKQRKKKKTTSPHAQVGRGSQRPTKGRRRGASCRSPVGRPPVGRPPRCRPLCVVAAVVGGAFPLAWLVRRVPLARRPRRCPVVIAPRYHPASSSSRQGFGALLVVVVALVVRRGPARACGLATTQPPHEQGLMAVVGVGQGAPVVVVNYCLHFFLVSRKKKRNGRKKNLPMAQEMSMTSPGPFFGFASWLSHSPPSSPSSGRVLGRRLVVIDS
jgi:hypothetical protein